MKKRILIYTLAAGMVLSSLSGCANDLNAGQDVETVVTEAETVVDTTIKTTGESAAETEESLASQTMTEIPPWISAGEMEGLESILVRGQVLRTDAESNQIVIDNQSDQSVKGEIVLNISQEDTKVLDAVDGLPVSLEDISEGEVIYAYIGPVMTLSLPPITTSSMIICKIPADFRVPEYVKVNEMKKQEDGSYRLTGTNETEYSVPANCVILPYLTRNMVSLEHVTKGNNCLVWLGEETQVSKLVLFAE